jgi:glycosyltransferase involved in cell wall biosynthesis
MAARRVSDKCDREQQGCLMSVPEVSVVVGVFDGQRYLRESLSSVLGQTGVSHELIVVDDGSTDASPAILEEFARQDDRVHVIRQENQGLTIALLRGCAAARGNLIARQDADDLSWPGRLQAQVELFRHDPRLVLAWSRSRIIGPEGETLYDTEEPAGRAEAAHDLQRGIRGPCHGSVMFRSDVYQRLGGYRAEFRFAQDRDLWLRMVEAGEVESLPQILYSRRVSDSCISAFRGDQQKRLAEIAKEAFRARQCGRSDARWLKLAATVSAESPPAESAERRSRTSYFIGKCLLDRRDSRAVRYLRNSVGQAPLWWKPRAALLAARLLCRDVSIDPVGSDGPSSSASTGEDHPSNCARDVKPDDVSIAIPTFHREEVLIETVQAVLALTPAAGEVLIVDQTPAHPSAIHDQLSAWHEQGNIRWIRLSRPSIPKAMNHALHAARGKVVLFLDDDIVPERGLIEAHAREYDDDRVWAAAGQVLQPGQIPQWRARQVWQRGIWRDLNFPFNSTAPCRISNCMAGNLSVRRTRAVELGGFDENFISLAYRFETDFARRLTNSGGEIQFSPEATIRHLQAQRGGTRVYGLHRTTCKPDHAVGDYYFALRHGRGGEIASFMGYRLYQALATRHNLYRPWWIPLRLIAELHGLLWAVRLARRGPQWSSLPAAAAECRTPLVGGLSRPQNSEPVAALR